MTERSKKNIIKKVYFDLSSPSAFAGVEKVYLEAHKRNSKISRKDVIEYLQTEPTYSIYRPARKKFKRLATIPSGFNSEWQCDLCDFLTLYKNNDGYRYLLVAIDVLSRKINAVPTYSKSPRDMILAFDKLFQKAKVKPHKIYSDRGLEFQSKAMLEYFEANRIQKYAIYSDDIHAGVVERANRTIKERLYRYFNQNKTHRWVDVIDKIVEGINNTPNRTTGVEPNSVNYKNAEQLRRTVYGPNPWEPGKAKPKYDVGDIVRISKHKGKFAKGYHPNYTLENFRIKEVYETKPPHYKVEDLNKPSEEITGKIYEPEILKVYSANLQQGGQKYIKPLLW